MSFLDSVSPGVLALFVFGLRLADVTLGTMRTISVVHGRTQTAVLLGFVEILIWIAAVSQVISRVGQHPSLMVFYAAGFAAGNAVGIALERRLAMGSCVVTMVSKSAGRAIAEALRDVGQRLTLIPGEGRDGPRELVYVSARRRDLRRLVDTARGIDPDLFYVVQFASDASHVTSTPARMRGGVKHK